MSGEYTVGYNIEPGEYYFWGDNVLVLDKYGSQINSYDDEKDFYLLLVSGKRIVVENGWFTSVSNIEYRFSTEDMLRANHMYRGMLELPEGEYKYNYEPENENLDYSCPKEECSIILQDSYPSSWYFHEHGTRGFFVIDKNTKYIKISNGRILYYSNVRVKSSITDVLDQHKYLKITEKYKTSMNQQDKIIQGNRFYFYVSICDPSIEILIRTKFDDCERIKNIYLNDSTSNYMFSVSSDDKEEICFILYLFYTHKVDLPKIFGVRVVDIYTYAHNGLIIDRSKEFKDAIDKLNITDILSFDKFYMKIEKYYPSKLLLDVEAIKTYAAMLSPEFEKRYFYQMYIHQTEYSRKYQSELVKLAELGLANPRWKSEFSVYVLVKSYYEDAIYQYRADWLGSQSLDIYIPSINVAIEYQGQQHYEAVDIFGGNDCLKEQIKRDMLKKEKCAQNNVIIIEWKYDLPIQDSNLKKLFSAKNIILPKKKELEINKMNSINVETKYVIYQYDEKGRFIAEHPDIKAACVATGTKGVGKVINGMQKKAAGFYWKKVPFGESKNPIMISNRELAKSTGEKKPVIQLDDDGETIKVFASVTEASKCIGVNAKSIRLCAKGFQKHAGGYGWKYVEE